MDINAVYQDALSDKTPIMLLWGGRGSGKSVFAAQKLILRTLSEDGHKFLIIRKYAVNLRNSVFSELVNVIHTNGFTDLFDITTSPLEINCKSNGNKIIFVGLDDGEKIKSIQGVTGAWVEEATQLTEQDFSQIDLSIRGISKFYKQIIMTFNPIDKKNWIYKQFFTKKLYIFSDYHTTYRDNPFVNVKEYEAKLKQYETDTNYYNVVAKGMWGERTETSIFTNWTVDTTISNDYTTYKTVYGGCDFGVKDPNTAILATLIEDTIYIIKEYYRGGITGPDMIKDMLKCMPLDIYYNCDSSQPSQIEEMKRAGIKALSVRKNKVVDGIEWLRGKKIRVHPDCKHTIEELELYQWRVDKDDVILNEPLDTDNHLMDALRYAFRELMGESMVGSVKATLRI